MILDLSLKNKQLYNGCAIEEVAGRLNLTTPIEEAVSIVGRNAESILGATSAADRKEIVLTGPMAVWAYLIVFHCAVHRTAKVYYDDGRNGRILVAAHG